MHNVKSGRRIKRLHNEEIKQRLEAQYQEAAFQEIYARRKTRVEHPFGISNEPEDRCLSVARARWSQAETSLLATCFNVARMITIFGVGVLRES